MVFDNLRLSISELFVNKLRAFLTVLGITIGIAAVVLLLSLGQSVQAYITNQFTSLGTNTIRISASPDSNGRLDPLTEDLAHKLNDTSRLPAISIAMPETTGNYPVVYENNQFTVGTTGATTDYLDVESRTIKDGRFYTSDEYNSSAQVAVIGTTTATNLFGTDEPGRTDNPCSGCAFSGDRRVQHQRRFRRCGGYSADGLQSAPE
jgi:putative ABC transport system permease protein